MTIDPANDEPIAADGDKMKESAPPASAAGPDDTAQLFAELDSLLERMLALPVNPLGTEGQPVLGEDVPVITVAEATPEAPLDYTTPPPPVSISQDLYLQEVLSNRETEAAGEHEATGRPAWQEPRPSDVRPPEPPPTELRPREISRPRPSAPEPWAWQRPLHWLNQAFELSTLPLGGLGTWLRGDRGRALLGWAGVLMLLAAAGLAARDWFAWPH